MICEILHPNFDALDDELGFQGLVVVGIAGRLGRQR